MVHRVAKSWTRPSNFTFTFKRAKEGREGKVAGLALAPDLGITVYWLYVLRQGTSFILSKIHLNLLELSA